MKTIKIFIKHTTKPKGLEHNLEQKTESKKNFKNTLRVNKNETKYCYLRHR